MLKFKGKKTYLVAIGAILTAAGAYLSGDISAVEGIQSAFAAVMAMCIRNGIVKE